MNTSRRAKPNAELKPSTLIVANNLLERVLGEVHKASRGFLHGRRVRKTKDSSSAAE